MFASIPIPIHAWSHGVAGLVKEYVYGYLSCMMYMCIYIGCEYGMWVWMGMVMGVYVNVSQ
ncbi:hypothetical protein EON63_09215 [archaeon]|nr:MAG: hypothetical protein EON63_09215 [archaeon]